MWGLRRKGMSLPEAAGVAAAEPILPEAALGGIAMADNAAAVRRFDVAMAEHAGALEAEPLPIDLLHGGLRVTGALEAVDREAGYLLWWRVGSIRERHRIDCWLKLLAWIIAEDRRRDACLLGLGGKGLEISWLEGPTPEAATPLLTAWLDAWTRGQSRLLPFAPSTSWAYVEKLAKSKGNEDGARLLARAERAADEKWFGNAYGYGFPEGNDAYAALAYDGGGPMEDPLFAPLAEQLLWPIVDAVRRDRP